MEDLELIITEETLGIITTNAKELLETIEAKCLTYKAANYSDDNIAEAKRDRAELNNLAIKVNQERIEREKKFMEPFNPFKDYVEKIKKTLKNASGIIDGKIKDYETREAEEKRKNIEALFKDFGTNLCTLDKIFDPAWLNKGSTLKKINEEIGQKISKIKSDLALIERLPTDDQETVKAIYLSTLSIEEAFARADELQASRERVQRIEKVKAIEESAPEEESVPAFNISRQVSEDTQDKIESEAAKAPTPEIVERTFRVKCTLEKLQAISRFLKENRIEFQKVDA